MSELPITRKEYENSVLAADFIHKAKNIFREDDEITEFRFVPKIKGYEILYKKNGESVVISIKFRAFFDGIRIKSTRRIRQKTFCAKTVEDNSSISKKIFD